MRHKKSKANHSMSVCGLEIEHISASIYDGKSLRKLDISRLWKGVDCKNCLRKRYSDTRLAGDSGGGYSERYKQDYDETRRRNTGRYWD